MPNIDGPDFLIALAGEFGTTEANTEFVSDALRAVNRAVKDVNLRADLQSQWSYWSNAEDDIPVDEAYEPHLDTGAVYYLIRMGRQYRAQDSRNTLSPSQWQSDWHEAIDEIRQDIQNDLDPDEDWIIGLGATSY